MGICLSRCMPIVSWLTTEAEREAKRRQDYAIMWNSMIKLKQIIEDRKGQVSALQGGLRMLGDVEGAAEEVRMDLEDHRRTLDRCATRVNQTLGRMFVEEERTELLETTVLDDLKKELDTLDLRIIGLEAFVFGRNIVKNLPQVPTSRSEGNSPIHAEEDDASTDCSDDYTGLLRKIVEASVSGTV